MLIKNGALGSKGTWDLKKETGSLAKIKEKRRKGNWGRVFKAEKKWKRSEEYDIGRVEMIRS